MASEAVPVSMVMTCDDAVEMMFMDGSRLQLSPCGSSFIYDPPTGHGVSHLCNKPGLGLGAGPSHPLYTSTRTQQRTCFVTSRCRSKVMAALEFRNRFASSPFLCTTTSQGDIPLELYADITQVEWSNSSGKCTFSEHPDHSLELTSVDSLVTIVLSPSAHDFSVKYLCKLQPDGDMAMNAPGGIGQDRQQWESSEDNRESSDMRYFQRTSTNNPVMEHYQDQGDGRNISQGGQCSQPHCQGLGTDLMMVQRVSSEERLPLKRRTRCKFWYTWVVQNHSVAHCPWYWRHPLDLLLNHHAEKRKMLDVNESIPAHLGNDETSDHDGNRHDAPGELQTRSSPLPPSLPLSCAQSHLHKHHWRTVKEEYVLDRSGESDTLTMYGRKVSVLVVGRVVYRLFWDPIPSIEIYPGNGDVLTSHDERGSFFRLVKVCGDGALKELMISASNPPPDTPHSSYVIADLVRRGSRLLQCILVHQRTIGEGDNLCCWQKMEKDDASASAGILIERSIIPGLGQMEAYSNGVIKGYFNDEVTMETVCTSRVVLDSQPLDLQEVDDGEIVFTVVLPGGCRKMVTSLNPGAYLRHVNALLEWKRWAWASSEERLAVIEAKRSNEEISKSAIQTELLRIKNLTYIIDAGNHGEAFGLENQNGGIKDIEGAEDNGVNPVSPSTEIRHNGQTLHPDQTHNLYFTKEDIAKALRDTALAMCDIDGMLGN